MLFHNHIIAFNITLSFIILLDLSVVKKTTSFQLGTRTPSKLYTGQEWIRSYHVVQSTRDVIADTGGRGFGYLTSPIRFASSPFWMDDYLDENDVSNTDISYLKFVDLQSLPMGSEMVLRKVTKTYIESDVKRGQSELKLSEVLDTIDSEYKYTRIPYKIGNNTISFESRADSQSSARNIMSKVLSFAALYRLPESIVVFLFGGLMDEERMDSETKQEIINFLEAFQKVGWNSVEFNHGLSLRVKRDYIVSRRKRFYPLPRKNIFTRSYDVLAAAEALDQAKLVHPPLKLIRKQAFVEEINRMENIQSELSFKARSSLKDMVLTFFPNKDKQLNRFLRATTKQTLKIRSVVRAGFISYCLLSFIWYTCSIFWQWYRFPESQGVFLVQGKLGALRRSMHKFSKIFVSTYFNPQLTKLYRFIISVLLAPFGNKALEWTQNKLKINADQAVGVISSLVVILSMGLWILIIISDATFSKASMGTFAM